MWVDERGHAKILVDSLSTLALMPTTSNG